MYFQRLQLNEALQPGRLSKHTNYTTANYIINGPIMPTAKSLASYLDRKKVLGENQWTEVVMMKAH